MSTTPSPAGAIAVRAAEEISFICVAPDQEAEGKRQAAAIIQRAITEANADDAKRLYWLIKNGPRGSGEGIGLNDDTWELATLLVSSEITTDLQAIRAAIDAAMTEPSASTAGTKETTL